MNIDFILNGKNFRKSYLPLTERFIDVYKQVDPGTRGLIHSYLKALNWNPEEVDEMYSIAYPQSEITDKKVNHLINFLKAETEGSEYPEDYSNRTFKLNISSLFSNTKEKIIEIPDEVWNSIESSLPSFITQNGFKRVKKLILEPSFIKGYQKLDLPPKDYEKINECFEIVFPCLIANKMNYKVYDLHMWKDKIRFGFHPIGGRGMIVTAVGRIFQDGYILTEIDTGHGIADVK